MQADFQDPRHLAVMALHLAGFATEGVDDVFLLDPQPQGFDLVFDAGEQRSLSLGWDEGAQRWLVAARFVPHSPAPEAARLGLALSALLPPGLRLQAVPESAELELCAEQALEPAPDALALLLLDVSGWLHRLADADAAQARQVPFLQAGGLAPASLPGADVMTASLDLHIQGLRA